MDQDRHLIERDIAKNGSATAPLVDFAHQGLLEFLRKQITDAEWEIAKQRARIEAYEKAIEAIGEKTTAPVRS